MIDEFEVQSPPDVSRGGAFTVKRADIAGLPARQAVTLMLAGYDANGLMTCLGRSEKTDFAPGEQKDLAVSLDGAARAASYTLYLLDGVGEITPFAVRNLPA